MISEAICVCVGVFVSIEAKKQEGEANKLEELLLFLVHADCGFVSPT